MRFSLWECEHTVRCAYVSDYLFTGVKELGVSSYLYQEEGHSICKQGPGELHILHFCLNLHHLSTVVMVLDKQYKSHLHLLD